MTKLLLNRNSGLDVLRSACLFFVVLQHSFLFTDVFFPKFRSLWVISNAALDVFFVMSGFLICDILYSKYLVTNTICFQDVFIFYKRRWFKTLPMYWLTLIVFAILANLKIYYANDFSWKFLFFIQNWNKADFYFLPHTYSLAIEEWFYIFFPLLILLCSKFYRKNTFFIVTILFLIAGIVVRFIVHNNGIENWDMEIRKSIIARFDATVYGILFYFLNLKFSSIFKKYKLGLLLGGVSIYFIAVFIFKSNVSVWFNNVFFFSIIPFSLTLLLPFFIDLKLSETVTEHTTKQSLASYSIYLIHLPIFYCISEFYSARNKIESIVLLFLSVALVYWIGLFFYKYFEKPIMNLRDKH